MAERKNNHLLDVTCTLILQAFVLFQFWAEALPTTVFLINRLPLMVIDLNSHLFCLFKVHPDYSVLHTFECVCVCSLTSI